MTDVCEHGRPDHQELIRQLLEALGEGTHARAMTPHGVFAECLAKVGALRAVVARLNDGWQYALPEGGGRKGRWWRAQDGAGNWLIEADATEMPTEAMTESEQLAIYGRIVT